MGCVHPCDAEAGAKVVQGGGLASAACTVMDCGRALCFCCIAFVLIC